MIQTNMYIIIFDKIIQFQVNRTPSLQSELSDNLSDIKFSNNLSDSKLSNNLSDSKLSSNLSDSKLSSNLSDSKLSISSPDNRHVSFNQVEEQI